MAQTVMIEIPTKVGPEIIEGKVAWLKVGDKRHKFFIHEDTLSDYRSGYKVAKLNDAKIRAMCQFGHNYRLPDREAAQETLDLIVLRAGLPKVLDTLKRAPALNG